MDCDDAGHTTDTSDARHRERTALGRFAERAIAHGVVGDLCQACRAVDDQPVRVDCGGVAERHAVRDHIADARLTRVGGHAALAELTAGRGRTDADRGGLLAAVAIAIDTGCRDGIAFGLRRGCGVDGTRE